MYDCSSSSSKRTLSKINLHLAKNCSVTKNQEFETTIREQQWILTELLGANVTQLESIWVCSLARTNFKQNLKEQCDLVIKVLEN